CATRRSPSSWIDCVESTARAKPSACSATNLAAPSTSCSNARSRSTSNASWQRNYIFGGEQVSPLSNSIHIGPNSFESHHPYAASTHATLRQLLAATVLIGRLLPSVSHNRSST